MTIVNDELENSVDESMIFFDQEKLRDTSQLIKYKCLTIAQCVFLLLLHLRPEKDQNVTEEISTYTMLAFNDINLGDLQALHPKTLLPWTRYLELIKAGMYGDADDLQSPMVTAGWLINLDDCEMWYRSKNMDIDLSDVKADIEKLNNEQEIAIDQNSVTNDEEQLAILFDPVPMEALETMFPANNKWKSWTDKAKRNGLIIAREGRAKFNPYKAGMWFVQNGEKGWDIDRLYRVLGKKLPLRSRDSAHLFSLELD